MNEYISTDTKSASPASVGSPPSRPSNPVPIKRFQEYVTRALVEDTLALEYTTLRNGKLHPATVAEKSDHRPKNRDGNVLPYDHSRVVLRGEGIVDYINASFIPDFRNPRRYIAAQSPAHATTSDFWQMVWQENIVKVVALSGPKEEAVYWPESRAKYGSITVTLKRTELKADFAVRELEVSVDLNTRIVTHFHYTAWPHGKMPPCTDSLESFITAVRAYSPDDTHPIMVHSRFGVGRTGTFILIDSTISQSEAEGEVDCLRQLHSMRHSRMNMVETQEQYIAAHKLLVNMACTKSRKLTIEEFLKLYQNLKATHPATGKSLMYKEFEELNRMRPHPDASEYKAARDECNAGKNRSQKILAADSKRPLLNVTTDHGKTDYINAVYVDGFRKPNAFLVTQMPLNGTLDDFWEMVASSGSVTVVTLGPLPDETTLMFWPDFNSSSKHGKITVEHRESTGFPSLVVRSFNICQNEVSNTEQNSSRTLKQFHCPTWKRLEKVPGSHEIVLDMLRRVDTWQMRADGAPVVVQCLDGCQECGLYCVLSSVCDQLMLEHEVDVFRCVQRVRASRPEFIVSADQYAFCYEVAHRFIDSFGSYSNFSG
ncbi:receptor-type tyrosine-protein phosphatase mu-like [Dermacentor albipictus]|uniref:receptor-type tyrosine-protein phosphatase mu-like n=1 Tax=Dermacentor albipictus TaxID=60249 RepID=UPI0038FC1EA1